MNVGAGNFRNVLVSFFMFITCCKQILRPIVYIVLILQRDSLALSNKFASRLEASLCAHSGVTAPPSGQAIGDDMTGSEPEA